jgi:molecular chaperone GrpE
MSDPHGAEAGAPEGAPAGPETGAVHEEDRFTDETDQPAEDHAAGGGGPETGDQLTEERDPAESLAAMAGQRDEYLDSLRRLQADFENYRKRVLRQQTELLERAAFDLVGKLLPILDTIDLALAHAQGGSSSDGLTQVATTARDALSREGLERLDPVGQPFDPAVHEAVAHEEASEESDKPLVSEVLRPGYRWKGQLLRPAMVKVTG